MPYIIALLTFCLAVGLLLAAAASPVRWLPAQRPLLIAACYAIALAGVFARRYYHTLSGLAARDYLARERLSALAFGAAILVGLPLLEWTRLHPGVDWRTGAFAVPAAVGIAAAALSWWRARDIYDAWHILYAQPWEDAGGAALETSAFDEERGPRINRSAAMRQLWRGFAVGGIVLSLALFGATASAVGEHPPTLVAVLLFATYILAGLAVIGRAALLRLLTDWRLDHLAVSDDVGTTWSRGTAALAVGAVVAIGIIVLTGALDLAHSAIVWLWLVALGPFIAFIVTHLPTLNVSPGAMNSALNHINRAVAPPRLRPGQRPGNSALLWWLTHIGPWALGAIVLAAVLWSYLQARKNGTAGGPWWRIFGAILAELRRLLDVLRRAARAIADDAWKRAEQTTARLETRRRRRARLGALGPRELVVYLYGQTVATAARRGYSRGGQTPREFADAVGPHLENERAALTELTECFEEARYSAHTIGSEAADRARQRGATVRARLKKLRS